MKTERIAFFSALGMVATLAVSIAVMTGGKPESEPPQLVPVAFQTSSPPAQDVPADNDAAQNAPAQNDAAQNDAAQNDAAQNDAAQNDAAGDDAAGDTPAPATEVELRKARQRELVRLVEAGKFSDAYSLLSASDLQVDWPLMNALSLLRAKESIDPQVHFSLIDFFLRYGQFGNAWGRDQIRQEYLQLVDQLQVADAEAVFLDSTNHLFDLTAGTSFSSAPSTDWAEAFAKCIAVLTDRPEDAAAWKGLANIMGYNSRATYEDLEQLRRVCNTPQSRIRLANLVVRCKFPADKIDEIVEVALADLSSDSQRAGLLYRAACQGKAERSAQQIDAATTRIIEAYPRVKYARSALREKLHGIASKDVVLAQRELDSVRQRMNLSAKETEFQHYVIAAAPFSDLVHMGGIRSSMDPPATTNPREKVIAKQRLDQLVENARHYRRECVDLRVRIADRENDREAMNKLGAIWTEIHKDRPLRDRATWDTHNVAPILAAHYAAMERWQLAYEAWELWPASNGGCGSWAVYPSEIRVVRMAICRLHQQKYRQAIELISKAMTDPQVEGRSLLPLLTFHIYRRADQAEDFWTILNEWHADEAFRRLRRRSLGMDSGRMTIARLHSNQSKMKGVLEFAENKNRQALIKVCRSDTGNSHGASLMKEYRYGSMLEAPLAALASVLLAEAGQQGAVAIEKYYQGLASNNDPAERDANDAWIIRALVENDSEEAQRFLQRLQTLDNQGQPQRRRPNLARPSNRTPENPIMRLARQTRQSRVLNSQDAQGSSAAMLREYFQWKSPPEGSLPKHIPLDLDDVVAKDE